MSITTKTGDDGNTSLLGGQRISKSSLRVNAYGDIDELNSCIGVAISMMPESLMPIQSEVRSFLQKIQNVLFYLGADLATLNEQNGRLSSEHIKELENAIDKLQNYLPIQRHFIIPGGSPATSMLHLARTVCRRAERQIVALKEKECIDPKIIIYTNRLSDYLFLTARTLNLDNK